MTFNEDQLKAYIQQTAWEVGNEICERLEKRMDEKIETHSLKCAKESQSTPVQQSIQEQPSRVKQMSYGGLGSSLVLALVEIIRYLKGN